MKQYRKKPIVIEAVQFDPQGEWPKCVIPWEDDRPKDTSWGYIETLEGKMSVIAGDWIIKGITGEFYPCKPEIFAATYDPVEEIDWKKAKKHFDAVRKQYQDLEGMPGVNTSFALRLTFDPLAKRYNSGERTEELYEEMMSVE